MPTLGLLKWHCPPKPVTACIPLSFPPSSLHDLLLLHPPSAFNPPPNPPSFAIVEKAPKVGGTWYHNRYPGCAVDIPSVLYSFSFHPNPNWSNTFPLQEEILAYLQGVAEHYHLMPHIRLEHEVTEATYNTDTCLWTVRCRHLPSGSERVLTSRFLVSGAGGLHTPNIPDFRDRQAFTGPQFHTAMWPHDSAPMDSDKVQRVGVVGSAASAIQTIPELVKQGKHVVVFQRTPNWIGPRPAYAIPAAVRALFRLCPGLMALLRLLVYLRQELIFRLIFHPTKAAKKTRADLTRLISATVGDKTCHGPGGSEVPMAEALVPDYPVGCKRILLSNDFYRALASSNCTLVTDHIERFAPQGIVTADGQLHQLDAVVLATGFRFLHGFPRVLGASRRDLCSEAWQDEPEAFLGITVPDFPNAFLLLGPNTGLGHNSVVWMIEVQIAYILRLLTTMRDRKLRELSVKPDVHAAYQSGIQRELADSVWSSTNCSSWYQNAAGKIFALWPGSTMSYGRRVDASTLDADFIVR